MISKEQIQLAPIMYDRLYLECLRLARFSKGKNQRYGSLVSKDGVILGRGYNRAVAHPSFGKLQREIYQGYSNHAEIEAINDALMSGKDVRGAEIFVGGYFPKQNGLLFFKKEYTCVRCPPALKSYGISVINIPTLEGWLQRSVGEALIEAQEYIKGGTYQNRLLSVLEQWTIKLLF